MGKEIKQKFLEDLKMICDKHNLDLELTDDGRGYGMASPLILASKRYKKNDYSEFFEFEIKNSNLIPLF